MSAGPARTLMGVVHLPPCPSARCGGLAVDALLERALADARALRDGGCDAILVENFGDAPFHKGGAADPVPADVVALLAIAAREARRQTGLPVAINCLRNDARAALGAAVAAGAGWIRVNVLSGAMVTDQGVVEGDAAGLASYARQLGAAGARVGVLADLLVKHAAPLARDVDVAALARDLAERSGATGVVLSGARTGAPVDPARLAAVRAAVGDFPIWIGSGLTPDTAPALWPGCDGAIVGTWLKRGGDVAAPVDPERVGLLRAAVDRASG
ncbi:MAG: BtpA/SgcQ family protein [Planctomycetes bacterium]|nr:BtpA/SgcQ family protein [Planctomycetota bacterium]